MFSRLPHRQVEVKNEMEGFGNSWSAAVVKKKIGSKVGYRLLPCALSSSHPLRLPSSSHPPPSSKFTVEYTGFLDEKDKPLNEAGIERKRLRLAPEAADKGWVPIVGEVVEVSEDDCWWEARVEELLGKGKASLKFRCAPATVPATIACTLLYACCFILFYLCSLLLVCALLPVAHHLSLG